MKNKFVIAFGGTLLVAAFAFSGITTNASSLQELKAAADGSCSMDDPNMECIDIVRMIMIPGHIEE